MKNLDAVILVATIVIVFLTGIFIGATTEKSKIETRAEIVKALENDDYFAFLIDLAIYGNNE